MHHTASESGERGPATAAVVLNWNGPLDTIACVESLLASERIPDRILVCDNGSSDDSVRRLRAWAEEKAMPYAEFMSIEDLSIGPRAPLPRLIFASWPENRGYAGGNNLALRFILDHLRADYVWILNNDTVVDKKALERQLALAQKDADIGILGAKLVMHHAPDVIQALGGGHILPFIAHDTQIGRGRKVATVSDDPVELDHVIGASLFVRVKAIRETGLINESYFLYREDTDWCIEMRKRGWRMVCCADAIVRHKESASLGAANPLRDYYTLRNMLHLVRTQYPRRLPAAWCYFLARALLPKLARLQFRRIRHVLLAYRDFSRGVRGRASFHRDEQSHAAGAQARDATELPLARTLRAST